MPRQNDGPKDRQNLFYRSLPATMKSPKMKVGYFPLQSEVVTWKILSKIFQDPVLGGFSQSGWEKNATLTLLWYSCNCVISFVTTPCSFHPFIHINNPWIIVRNFPQIDTSPTKNLLIFTIFQRTFLMKSLLL